MLQDVPNTVLIIIPFCSIVIITLIQYYITNRQYSKQRVGFKDRIYGIVTSAALIGGYISLLHIFLNFNVLVRNTSSNTLNYTYKHEQADSQHKNNLIQPLSPAPSTMVKRGLVQTFTPSF